MSEKPIYLMIASMDVEPEYEALFHEVYDTEHVPFLSQVPGVISVRRYQREELTMNIGGAASNHPPGKRAETYGGLRD